MRVIYKNKVSEVKKLGDDIEQFGKDEHLTESILYDLHLCVEEAITNIIRYGFVDQKFHPIELTVERYADKIVAIIQDEGIPFNPLEHIKKPILTTSLEEKPIGGLGIYFLKEKMDALEYMRHEKYNILKMTKYLNTV